MSKSIRIAHAQEQMRRHLHMPAWSVEEKVVLAGHILHAQGHDSGLAGQITARLGDSADFITQPMGLGLDELTVSNLLHANEELEVLAGSGMPNPANRMCAASSIPIPCTLPRWPCWVGHCRSRTWTVARCLMMWRFSPSSRACRSATTKAS